MDQITHDKIKHIDEVTEIIQKLKTQGKKIVLCHGVFDLLHPGHIRHLDAAKHNGDVLIVSVTPDQFVNRGPGRPVFQHKLAAFGRNFFPF